MSRTATLLLCAFSTLAGVGTGAPAQAGEPGAASAGAVAAYRVGPVPRRLRRAHKLSRFYRKHVAVGGLPILASARPRDHALLEAAWVIDNMLRMRPDVLRTLAQRGIRVCVMAHDEYTTQVPEHATLRPAKWWDYRARGLGPGPERPVVSCAEENLLGFPGDTYASESILVHEFAHAIDIQALRVLDPTFERTLEGAYKAALAKGLWKGTYAATTKEEYWAEGVQAWFDTNRPADSLHNHVDTRGELEEYDPRLAKLIERALGDNDWRYVSAKARAGRGHLAGYDAAQAPTFRWPEGLADWYWAYEKKKATGADRVELPAMPSAASPPRSPTTWRETSILFMNRTTLDLKIWWLGYGGTRKPYGTVRAGRHVERSTLVKHIWIVTDDAGREVARFRAGIEPGRAVIHEPPRRR